MFCIFSYNLSTELQKIIYFKYIVMVKDLSNNNDDYGPQILCHS